MPLFLSFFFLRAGAGDEELEARLFDGLAVDVWGGSRFFGAGLLGPATCSSATLPSLVIRGERRTATPS